MILEIVGPDGAVHYTRPHDHVDVMEALKTLGYSVRPCPEQANLVSELRKEANINSLCGSEEFSALLNSAATQILALESRVKELEVRLNTGSLQPDYGAALFGIIGVCEAYQNTDFEGMDDDKRADLGYTCSMAVIRMASAALLENMAQFTSECLCRKCGKQFQLPSNDAPHICPSCQ